MKKQQTRGWIRNLIQSWLSRPRRKTKLLSRLRVEALEDRVVPSAWVVTSASNSVSTSGSLPWAVAQADIDTSNATITFNPADFASATTITLAAQLSLSNTSHSITVNGSGAGPITVSGGGTQGIFKVNSGVTAVIENLAVSDGSANYSGGIYNLGTVTVNNVALSNMLGGEGAIYNGGSATVENSTVTNSVDSGIYTIGTTVVQNCTISGNSGANGGGIFDEAATLTVLNCTISGNTAGSEGGGVDGTNGTPSGTDFVTIIGSTISGNTAWGSGGTYNAGGTMTLVNSTVVNNVSTNAVGGGVVETGANSIFGRLTAENCTITGNTATSFAGGGLFNNASCTLSLRNCLIAGNTAQGAGYDIDNASASTTVNYTLVGNTNTDGITGGTGNLLGPASSGLGTLGNYGGPTQTVNLVAGSPPVGAGGSVTTTNAAITSTTATSMAVANGTLFASAALPTLSSGSYFTIQIDGEEMAVTGLTLGSGTTATLTVVRGVNGTTAATHASGASVYLVADQRGYVAAYNSTPILDMGAFESTGSNLFVTAVSPNSGSSSGGTAVTITGSNFTGATAVLFGGTAAASFTVVSATKITAVSPAEAAGTVDITVTTPSGTTAISANDEFTFAPLVVTNTSSSAAAVGSLPWCVAQANVAASNADITFAATDFPVAATITVTSTLAMDNTAHSITIDGTGAGPITISGGGTVEVLSTGGVGANVTLNDLTISGGAHSGGTGGGIADGGGTLLVDNCTITGNSAAGVGGGIFSSGTLTVENSTVSGNTSAQDGGGIFSEFGPVTLQNDTIENNTANTNVNEGSGGGGGFESSEESAAVTDCTISGNTAAGSLGAGGGIGVSVHGTLTVTGSTISNNTAGGTSLAGGGIAALAGTVFVTNDTISGNSGASAGGGIALSTATATISNSTISGGTAATGAGVYQSGATLTVQNASIIENNNASNTGGGVDTASGTTFITGSTISGNSSGAGGGGISEADTIVVSNSTISGNSAVVGGGVLVDTSITILDSTISGNTAGNQGGGGFCNEGTLTLLNSTIAGNSATAGGPGGGIDNFGTANVTNSTMTGNSGSTGGGIFNDGTVSLENAILAGNSAALDPDVYTNSSFAAGYSMIGNTAGSGLSAGNGNILNPSTTGIGTLGNYGGPTQTVNLVSGSPAIGAAGAVTQITGSIAFDSATTITVASGAVFAAGALPTLSTGSYFTIQIDGEQMAVTGLTPESGSTANLTVVRGSTPTTHAANAPVYVVSDQRGYLAAYYAPPEGDMGAFESTGSTTFVTVSPNSGNMAGGTLVTLTGTNFTGATAVNFGSTPAASFSVVSSTEITAVAPAEPAGSVNITVTLPSGTTETAAANLFTFAPLVVTDSVDTSAAIVGTFAWCVAQADVAASNANITFSPYYQAFSNTNFEAATQLVLGNPNTPITITGPSAGGVGIGGPGGGGGGAVTIVGGNNHELFDIPSSADVVTIVDVNFSDGRGTGPGAAFDNSGNGTLTLIDCTLSGNSSGSNGGAIDNPDGVLTIDNCAFTSNTAAVGGAISVDAGNSLAIENCTFSSNHANGNAGAINFAAGSAVIDNCTFFNNYTQANSDAGGAIDCAGSLTLSNSTLYSNSAGSGGGIFNNGGTVTLTNVTMTENDAGDTATSNGGAIDNAGTLTVIHSTISGNSASGGGDGGGLYCAASATETLTDSIVAGNVAAAGSDMYVPGAATNTNYTLIGNTVGAGQLSGTGNILNPASAGLGSFGNYGSVGEGTRATPSYAQTIPLTSGSPAIDAGGAITTLSAPMAATDTTLTVASSAVFGAADLPALGVGQITTLPPFSAGIWYTIQIDSEQMNVMSMTNGTIAVTRGVNGTTAAVHAANAPIYLVADGRQILIPGPVTSPAVVCMGAFEVTATAPNNFTVTNTSNSVNVNGSLPWCVANANAAAGNSIITFDPDDFRSATTLYLQTTQNLSNTGASITVDGSGAGPITLYGVHPFNVNAGVTAALDDLNFTGAYGYDSGGGVYNAGTLTLANCTISGETANSFGAGIWNSGTVTVINCTITGNSLTASGFGNGKGAGIYNSGAAASATVVNSTITGNACLSSGGGIYSPAGASLTLINTILAGNSAQTDPDISSAATNGNNNIIGNGNGMTGSSVLTNGTASDQVGTAASPINPLLGPLANNGGLTETMALLTGSPALGTGDPSQAGTTSQNGVIRPAGFVDIGAWQGVPPAVTPNTANLADSAATLTIAGSNFDPNAANESVTFNNGVTGTVTSATATQLIVALSTPPAALGSLTAEVTVDGISNGSYVQVATEVNGTWVVTDPNGNSASGSLTDVTLPYAVSHVLNGDAITFAGSLSGDTITLNSTLDVDASVTITGLGAANLAISGNNSVQVFNVASGVTDSISSLTVENGYVNGNGGGIFNDGNLTLTNMALSSNLGESWGGGLLNSFDGTVSMTDDTLSGDSAFDGGGIVNLGTMTQTNDTVSGNTATSIGGGVWNSGTMTLSDDTLADNLALRYGGGIYNNGTINSSNDTIAGNAAHSTGFGSGGGVFNSGAMTLSNDSVSDNSAQLDAGGVFNEGTTTLSYDALSSNSAGQLGGGIYSNSSAQLTLTNCTFTDNTAITAGAVYDVVGPINVASSQFVGNVALHSGGAIHSGGNSLTVTGSTFTDNTASTNNASGGGIDGGIVTVTNSTFSDNYAFTGGGGVADSVSLLATDCVFANNTSPGMGGGIWSNTAGQTTLTDCTISDNTANGDGGGIYVAAGTASIDDSTVNDNTATQGFGGGIYISAGTATITGSTLSGNSASYGGGISNNSSVAVSNSIISGNTAYQGGGSYNNAASLTVSNSTISGNSAGYGGAIFNLNQSVSVTVSNSTISGNSAGSEGGGIENNAGSTTVSNSTISGNSTGSYGGGIFSLAGSVAVSNSTIAENSAGVQGAGIYNVAALGVSDSTISGNSASLQGGGIYNNNGSAVADNTIVAGNTASSAPDVWNSGSFSATYSVIGNTSGSGLSSGTGNILNPAYLGLGTLGNYCGPTETIPLLSGSPAIGTGDPSQAGTTSQNGVIRPAAPYIDMGAYQGIYVATSTAGLPVTATSMTINGAGFDTTAANDNVTLSNGVTGTVTAATSTSLTVSLAGLSGLAGGTALYASATVDGVSSGNPVQVATVVAPPVITNVAPSSGPLTGGTLVTITGSGFAGNMTVTFGSQAATNVMVSVGQNQITCITPAGIAPGAVDIIVNSSIDGSATIASGFTYLAAPTITSVSPNSGPTTGGTTVTITGTGFTGTVSVQFGANPATNVIANPAGTQITCITPAGTAPGAVDVTVNSSTNGTATIAGGFTYVAGPTITSVSPNSGPLAGGTVVTITGTGFTGTVSVQFGANLATNVQVNPAGTQITCTVPAGTSAGAVDVIIVSSNTGSATSAAAFVYVTPPTVSSSTAGILVNTPTLTINGSGFDPIAGNNMVTFNDGAIGTVTSATATSLTVTFSTQPSAAGSLTAVVTTDSVASGSPVQVATVSFMAGVVVNGDYAPIVDISSDGVSTVTVTTDGNNGFTAGNTVVISGYTGLKAGYNGTFVVQSASGDTFTVTNTTAGLPALTPSNGGNAGFAISQNTASDLLGVQRSMVDSVVYTFSSPVSLTPANFTLAASTPAVSGAPAFAPAPATLVPGMVLTSLGGGSIWVVTWASAGGTGGTVIGHSIADGVYELTLADSNEQTDTFYRLYGDVAGYNFTLDRACVYNADSLPFTHSYLLSTGAAMYLADVDYDANGVINNTDSLNFTHRYLSLWTGFIPTI